MTDKPHEEIRKALLAVQYAAAQVHIAGNALRDSRFPITAARLAWMHTDLDRMTKHLEELLPHRTG